MFGKILTAATLVVALAFNSSAFAQEEWTLDEIKKSGEMICKWNGMENKKNAVDFVQQAGLEVVQVSNEFPFIICRWKGDLDQKTLTALRDNKAIAKVSGVTYTFLGQDSPQPNEDQTVEQLLRRVRDSGELICKWYPYKKSEGIDFVENKLKLKVIHVSVEFPFIICEVNGDFKRETLVALLQHPSLEFVDVPKVTFKEPTEKGSQTSVGGMVVPPNADFCKPNDPKFISNDLWGMTAIRAPQAWCKVQVSDVIVAVIDTGVDYTHRDLAQNMWRNPKEIPGNGIDDDGNNFIDDIHGVDFSVVSPVDGKKPAGDPKDIYYHGTHVAGTISATGNNGEGVVGVVWRGKIMALQVFRPMERDGKKDVGARDANIAEAIKYAVNNGAKVINLSLGGPGTRKEQDEFYVAAMKIAEEKDVLVVCAAGNSNGGVDNDRHPQFPASFENPNIIAVANMMRNGQLSPTSHFGVQSVHIAAPGTEIWSTFPSYSTVYMQQDNFPVNYANISGTSMAAPHVAGAAALILGDPRFSTLSAVKLKALLVDKGRALTALQGKVSAAKFLDVGFLHESAPNQPQPKPTPVPPPVVPPPHCIVYQPPCYHYCPQLPKRCYPPCRPRSR